MKLVSLIANKNYVVYNKEIAKNIGLYEAILLGELCAEYDYWEQQNGTEDGWFYSTAENIENNTSLTYKQQKAPLKHLEELNLIHTSIRGIPAKKYFKLDITNMSSLFVPLGHTGIDKKDELDDTKGTTNSNNKSNNKSNKEEESSSLSSDNLSYQEYDSSSSDGCFNVFNSDRETVDNPNPPTPLPHSDLCKDGGKIYGDITVSDDGTYKGLQRYIDTMPFRECTKDALKKFYEGKNILPSRKDLCVLIRSIVNKSLSNDKTKQQEKLYYSILISTQNNWKSLYAASDKNIAEFINNHRDVVFK